MAESLKVLINNTYTDDYRLTSTAQIWNNKALVSEWTTDDPRAMVYKGIEAAEPNVFEQIKIKKVMEKAATLFEATSITIEGK